MNKLCDFSQGCTCPNCGRALPERAKCPTNRICRPASRGLGDQLEAALAEYGITEEWYASVKQNFGLPPRCGCKKRKEWLNKVSKWWRSQS